MSKATLTITAKMVGSHETEVTISNGSDAGQLLSVMEAIAASVMANLVYESGLSREEAAAQLTAAIVRRGLKAEGPPPEE